MAFLETTMLAFELFWLFLLALFGALWAYFFWLALAFFFAPSGPSLVAPVRRRRSSAKLTVSSPPPVSPERIAYFSGSPYAGTEKEFCFAWNRADRRAASRAADDKALFARLESAGAYYKANAAEIEQRMAARRAARTQVPTQWQRHPVARPRPVSTVPEPPAVEPWDPVAWSTRLEAFHEAISMPNCSLLPDPKLVLGCAAPVQQYLPVRVPEMPQPKPAPAPAPAAPAPAAPSLPPKRPASPPPAAAATAPPPPPTIIITAAEEPRQEQPPPPPPAQAPRAAKAQPPAPKAAASNSAAAKSTETGLPPPFSGFALPQQPTSSLPPSSGLTPAQRKHRATMEKALDVLESVRREGEALGGKLSDLQARGWVAWDSRLENQRALNLLASDIQMSREVMVDDDDDFALNERVFPKKDWAAMLVGGEGFEKMVRGFQAGESALRAMPECKGFEVMKLVSKVSNELIAVSNLLGRF